MEELELLISRAQAGDLDAYGGIVQQFQDMVVGYAYSILGDFHLAEDAVQEAFIEAYPIISKVYGPVAFPGWFRRIIFKHCNRLTRGKRDELMPLETMLEMPSGGRDPAEEIEEQETKSLVLAAVAALPENQRQVTTLFYISGFSQKQIADFLEVPVTTVDNRLRASRKRLKATLHSERMITMLKDTLHRNAPSRDDSFVNAVGICNAAQAGDLQRVQEILAIKPELATQDIASNNEHQPIHLAAEEGHAEIVHVLLEAGADPLNGIYPHREATSALTMAKDRGHTSVVEVIEGGSTSNGGRHQRVKLLHVLQRMAILNRSARCSMRIHHLSMQPIKVEKLRSSKRLIWATSHLSSSCLTGAPMLTIMPQTGAGRFTTASHTVGRCRMRCTKSTPSLRVLCSRGAQRMISGLPAASAMSKA